MIKNNISNYIDFLNLAQANKENIKTFKAYEQVLYEFTTSSKKYVYVGEYSSPIFTPNRFAKLCGVTNYSWYVATHFSKLKDLAYIDAIGGSTVDYYKWYCGYFGGLVGQNYENVNNFIGTGEVIPIYDYDINQAYLHELTKPLPSDFLGTIPYFTFLDMSSSEKRKYAFFFEIEVPIKKIKFFSCVGQIRPYFKMFDFLNSKSMENKYIVSEKRLELIKKVYFSKEVRVKRVYCFSIKRHYIFEKILEKYLELKNNYGSDFKKNALKLYGCFGQIYKKKPQKIIFGNNGELHFQYSKELNYNSSPQVAMWVADSVAEKLFEIIVKNYDSILSWNTDGVTSMSPLPLKIDKRHGLWKVKKFFGFPFLPYTESTRVCYYDLTNDKIVGSDCIFKDENSDLFLTTELKVSKIGEGLARTLIKTRINLCTKFDYKNSYRALFYKERVKRITRAYREVLE